ncbi:nucleotide-diphospho-sugar transferase [Pilaira anomala]|nr:nucleotide-diphospho-sugar transferase [Pilaira anomala]
MVTYSTVNGAWAIVLTSTNDYVKGVFAIKHALHNLYNSQYPLLVLYTSAVVPEVVDQLKTLGCIVKEIQPIVPTGKVEYKFERFVETWTKLAVWNQSEYDRLVLLDADMLPLQNMDELMRIDLPNKDWVAACHACICNPQKIKHYPDFWVPENCSYTDTKSIEPRLLGDKSSYFNSGLIVLAPHMDKFNQMVSYLNSIPDLNIYPFPDQDFLNEIFGGQWVPLSYIYNALKTLQSAHEPMWDMDRVKNVHYILTKPWDIDVNKQMTDQENVYKPLYKIWWNNYNAINDISTVN